MRPLFVNVLGALLLLPMVLHAETICKPMGNRTRDRLKVFIAHQYKVSGVIDFTEQVANDSCYRLLHIAGGDGLVPSSLYLSPDLQYLMPSIMDVTMDPAVEEARRVERELMVEESPMLGPENADRTIVAFVDFQCPDCKRLFAAINRDVLVASKTRVVLKHYPLVVHPWARAAAEAAVCAGFQNPDEFWKMHAYIMQNQGNLTAANIEADINEHVRSRTAINVKQFASCLTFQMALGIIERDLRLARKMNVSAAPTIFVNGIRWPGNVNSPEQVRSLLENRTHVTSGVDCTAIRSSAMSRGSSGVPQGSAPAITLADSNERAGCGDSK